MIDALRKFAARSLENIADLVEAAQVPIVSEHDDTASAQWKAQREGYLKFNRDQVNRAEAIRAASTKLFG